MVEKYSNFLKVILSFVFLFYISATTYAQCAGEDNDVTICNVSDVSNQTLNLFDLLKGSPVPGGEWTDDDETGGLDVLTGVLNVQLIRQSGVYHYTYKVEGLPLCPDNSATLTLTIGGYSGITSPNVSVCSAVETFNLFSAFNGVGMGPHSNGQWHNDTTNRNVGAVINVENLEGTFQFTYTMPAISTCPAMSSTAIITIFRSPESGDPKNLSLCGTDGLAAYTNYDLNNLLTGQDPDGVWIDLSATGELTSSTDHFVDLQKIFDAKGEGTYSYGYRVKSTNPICSDRQSTVRIRLEKKLDFTGAEVFIDPPNLCEKDIPTATYSVKITKGPAAIPNTTYFVSYSVSGPNAASETITANFINGVLIFPIKSDYFQQIGHFTVKILNIVAENSSRACTNIINDLSGELTIYPIPDLTGAKIVQAVTCQGADATVQISDAAKVADGIYQITYNLSGANTVSGQIARVTFAGGIANDFIIPGILNAKSGTTEIEITSIALVVTPCENAADLKGNLLVNSLPNVSGLRIQINDVCFGSPVTASVSGLGSLTDVKLSYVLSGSNTSTLQTIDLTATGGNASFVVPADLLLNLGSTTATVTNLTNNITNCGVNVSGVANAFLLNPIPVAPTALDQSFCKSDRATIANLEPNGAQYKWYISATETTPLEDTYLLKSESYWVRQTILDCESDPTMITVTLKDTPAPELNPDGQNFCGTDVPTIADLSNNTNIPSSIVWYDAPDNGNVLPSTTILRENITYYGFDFDTTTGCLSFENLSVIPDLTDCNTVPDTFFVPDGFSPNGDGINDTFVIPDIDFLYPDYTLEIFNRYGNGMYRSYKNKPGWDGINYETQGLSHGIAPNGVYFYILNFNKGNKPPQQGRLYLNR
ncbi:gliding motility-associated C-terminal domain-containing protein [Flavobacterium sp. LAR06]|uniref:gliding motility-associated C-terminal domain-containing protein n=1 Tax=Flavobacterium sp. LAR06 TaxID=3064897 RepID=UPI0035C0915F